MSNPNCSVCGRPFEISLKTWRENNKWKCLHDDPKIGAKDDMGQLRKDNRAMTSEAMKQASMARVEQDAIDPEVTIDPKTITRVLGEDRTYDQPVKVRKSVLDRIDDRSPYKDKD